ncbi:MAG: condensation domain-containing protein, partial [Clostridium sp.]
MNANGKLNRKELPEIEMTKSNEYVAPRTEIEKILVSTFEEILGIDKIGIKDSFFALGGDSIKAIRAISKIRQLGYTLTAKDLIQSTSIQSIANKTKLLINKDSNQENIYGYVPLTPIQKDFYAWNLENKNYFNQAFMLKADIFEENSLRKALREIIIHHDELRAVFINGRQEIKKASEENLYDFYVYDFTEIDNDIIYEKVKNECTKIQKSINLETGSLVKIALFKTQNKDHLLICIHHLVVDGVSWRIILEDLETAYYQALRNEVIKLPNKTASYKEWSEALEEYKNTNKLKNEKNYWFKVNEKVKNINIKGDLNGNGYKYNTLEIKLDKEKTEKLLYKISKTYNTEINDILLTALMISIGRSTGQNELAVKLESHGREEIHKPIEIDRTVGWFTSMYPVALTMEKTIKDTIIATKETLRKIPNKGLGFGILKNDIKSNIKEEKVNLCFNYLGNFDSELNDSKLITISDLDSGEAFSDEVVKLNDITFTGLLKNNIMSFNVIYNNSKYSDSLIEKIMNNYVIVINEIIECCMNNKPEKTPSDYNILDIDKNDFYKIKEKVGEENLESICSLTLMQEGMLYHKILDEDSTSYFIQQILSFNDTIEIDNISKSIKLLCYKYDVFRTSILYKNLSTPRQVVLKHKETEFSIIDISKYNNKEEKFEQIANDDINRGFDLEEDSLMRITIVKYSECKYKMLWSFHHIIVDGWCISLVLQDFIKNYTKLKDGENIAKIKEEIEKDISNVAKYTDYVKYIENVDKEESKSYFRKLLEDYVDICEIKPLGNSLQSNKQVENIERVINLQLSNKVSELSQKEKVTINSILELAYGIVLQKYSNNNDIVFGKVVSGRNVDIQGIDKTVGLFINTIPVRIKNNNNTCKELLHLIQEQSLESMKYDYCPLLEIQKQSELDNDLIKTLFAFENYYMDNKSIKEGLDNNKIIIEKGREQTNYNITISAFMNKTINLSILYNPMVYAPKEAERILERIEIVLGQLVNEPEKLIDDIEIVTEEEKKSILLDFNKTEEEYPRDKCIQEIFEEMAS